MKPSRSRIKNAIAKKERREAGKPKQSKYEAKRFAPPAPTALGDALAARKCGNCNTPIQPMTGICECPYPGDE